MAADLLYAFAGAPDAGVDRGMSADWLRGLVRRVAARAGHRLDPFGSAQLTEDAVHEVLAYLLAAGPHGRPRAWDLADRVKAAVSSDANAYPLLARELTLTLTNAGVNTFAGQAGRRGRSVLVRPTLDVDIASALELAPSGLWHSLGGPYAGPTGIRSAGTLLRVRTVLANLGHRPTIIDDLAAIEPVSKPSGRRSGGRASRAKGCGDRDLCDLGMPTAVQARVSALAKAVVSRPALAPTLAGLSQRFLGRVLALAWMEAPESEPTMTARTRLLDDLDRRRGTWHVLDTALADAGVPGWVLDDALGLMDTGFTGQRAAGVIGALAKAMSDDPARFRDPRRLHGTEWTKRTNRIRTATTPRPSRVLRSAS